MIIKKTKSPFNAIIIEDVFSKKEIDEIWNEIFLYMDSNVFKGPEQTGAAKTSKGSLLKKNLAVFLDNLYTQEGRRLSKILKYTEKKLFSESIKDEYEKINDVYGILKNADSHFTLLNYYENSDYYDFHRDGSSFSILTYIYKDPKSFSGGNVVFKNHNGEELEIEIKNNMSIIFPSSYMHKVIPIKMENVSNDYLAGRFSIAQFIGIGVNAV